MKSQKIHFLPNGYSTLKIVRDILAGAVIALVSIPISMGYAEISGLPMVAGLYGSLLPILIFGLLTSTKNFVFGVDAAPAALIAGTLTSLGISGTEAQRVVPVLAVFTAVWLLIFGLFRAGRAVKYISTPVMGGFITGICCTIILMQVPKLWGGKAGTGELHHLLRHMYLERGQFHLLSFLLGFGTILVILLVKKLLPKLPMTALVMIFSALFSGTLRLSDRGVRMLPDTSSGLPKLSLPDIRLSDLGSLVFPALTIALVVTSETLLASRQNALSDGGDIRPNREIISYAAANLLSGLSGSTPVNGSVSRTGIARSFGAGSQILSISASGFMALILLFGTGLISKMPVPVLTGIVISALIGASEFHLAHRLLKQSKKELFIFLSAMFGVLVFGTVRGVAIGVTLSFIDVLIQAVTPPRSFLGCIPGREGFYNLERHKNAHPIERTVIYRFSGNLFFANIDLFQQDIEAAIRPDTKQVIIYASGIGSIDISAADRLILLYHSLEKRGIRFYITEHEGHINEFLHLYGADELLDHGVCRISLITALRAADIRPPYPLDLTDETESPSSAKAERIKNRTSAGTGNEIEQFTEKAAGNHTKINVKPESNVLTEIHEELEWVFSGRSEAVKRKIFEDIVTHLEYDSLPEDSGSLLSLERSTQWGRLSYMDEDEILYYIELYYQGDQFTDISDDVPEESDDSRNHVQDKSKNKIRPKGNLSPDKRKEILAVIEKRRDELLRHAAEQDPGAENRILVRREHYSEHVPHIFQ